MVIFEIEPDDDITAFDRLPQMQPVATVVLRDPVTGDVQRVNAEQENIVKIFKSVGYQVVEDI